MTRSMVRNRAGEREDVMSGLFYNIGRRMGRAAVPLIRKSRWVWKGLTGSDEEALRAEHSLGRALAVEVRNSMAPVDDPALARLLKALCERLQAQVRDSGRSFYCEAIQADSPNAMALPGGFIFLSESLASLCERNPDELAFVIGHEMGHILHGHAWTRMINQTALQTVSVVAARTGPLGAWLRHKGLDVLQSAHDRDCEDEADDLGLHLAQAAGFNPAGALQLLRRIEGLGQEPSVLGQYLASHPPAASRRARLAAYLRERSTSGSAARAPGSGKK